MVANVKTVPVAVYTRDGNRWQVDDTAATVEHVMTQIGKNPRGWLPVLGPLEGGTGLARMLAGSIRCDAVIGVFPERSQP